MDIEFLILADAAQVVDGKLYLMGGGWTTLTVESLPVQHRCGVAASLDVPWGETNQKHNVEIEVATEDGQSLVKVAGQVEAGRPPGLPRGQSQRALLAFEMSMNLEHLGTYAIITRVEGIESRRIHFNVMPGPLLTLKLQRGEGAA